MVPNPDEFDYISYGYFIHKTIISLQNFGQFKILNGKKAKKAMVTRESIHYLTGRLFHSVRFHGPPCFYYTAPHEHYHMKHKHDMSLWSGNSKYSRHEFLQRRSNTAKSIHTFFCGNSCIFGLIITDIFYIIG